MLKIGIVGTGYWGKHYVRIISNLPNVELSVVCDKLQENLDKVNERFSNITTTTDIEDMLSNYDIQAVIVVTPTGTHYDVVKLCLERELHVLVEKPLTDDSVKSFELLELSKKVNRKLMVGHTYLFNSCVDKIKNLISTDKFGKVHSVIMQRTNFGPVRKDVNVIWDLATHDISILFYLFGDLDIVDIQVAGNGIITETDTAFILLKTKNNMIINIVASWISTGKTRTITITGEHQKIVFDEMNKTEALQLYNSGLRKDINKQQDFDIGSLFMDGDIHMPSIQYSEPLTSQVLEWIACIGNGTASRTDAEFSCKVVKLLEDICSKLEA